MLSHTKFSHWSSFLEYFSYMRKYRCKVRIALRVSKVRLIRIEQGLGPDPRDNLRQKLSQIVEEFSTNFKPDIERDSEDIFLTQFLGYFKNRNQ